MSGLLLDDNKRSLLLRSSSLFVNIDGFVASTLARLCFFNQFDDEAEAMFVYNDNETFITDFHATVGQRKVHMEIQELSSGKETERFDVHDQTDFVISIGKIPPNALVLLEVNVLGELETAENGQALVFKTPESFTPFSDEFSDECNKTQAYKFDLKIRSDMPFQLAGCHSPSHAIQVDADAYATSADTVFITLAEEFRYDQQIKVYFYPAKPLDVYTSIELGIAPTQETNNSPRNTRYSVVNPPPDFMHNAIQRKESLVEKHIPDLFKNKEVGENTIRHYDVAANNKTENIFHIRRSSDGLLSEINPQQFFEDVSCLKELTSKLNDVCPEVYQGNQETSYLTEHPKDSFMNSEKMDSKVSFEENFNSNEKDDFVESTNHGEHSANCNPASVWSKQMLKQFEKGDGRNSEENTTSMNSRTAEYNRNIKTQSKHFLSDSIIAASFLPDLSNYPVCGEYIFMLDRSGSMNGSYICNAKESLVLFLKSLPTSSYFNVVSFGSYSRSLFPCSQRYSQDSLEKGCVYVNSIKADMGGSELLQPLKAVLEKPHKTGYLRNVFVLTDGDIAQPDAILKYLKMKCHKTRIFTFGIGPKISQNTVCNIARYGGGNAYFTDSASKVQTKVIQCLKDVLTPALCEVTANWRLPSNCQLLRPSAEIPFAISGQRINLYALAELPPRAQSGFGEKRKSSSVKEFWFDEELDSCQLGDNMFCDNEEFPEYWGTDTDISTSDCEQQYDEVGNDRGFDVGINRSNIVRGLAASGKDCDNEETALEEPGDQFETAEKIEPDQSHVEDISVENWRKIRNIRLYSSDTSTETEDECQADCENRYDFPKHLNIENISYMNTPERESSQKNSDFNHNHYVIDSVTKYSGLEASHDVICYDVTHNDVIYDVRNDKVIPNDLKSVHITENGEQDDGNKQNEVYVRNYETSCINKKSKENVIDCDSYEMDDDIEETTEITSDKTDSDWGSILITGYIGPDIHRERIPLCLNGNSSHSISLHQMAAKKFINGMEATLDNTADSSRIEKDIAALSKESRVHSYMTSITIVDDMENTVCVSQTSWASRRCKQALTSFPKPSTDDTRPAILVSCPSVDQEPLSPTKRGFGISRETDAISDDGKYYRIERLDPEGCDQGKRETRRKRLVDCRNIPGKSIHRRKIVSTRLTLLTRKMRNANKLNVFAGPPYIRLILLQSAEGFWQLTYAFARIVGLPLVQLELAAPFVDSTMIPLAEQDDRLGIDCYYDSLALWATALALVYLRIKWMSQKEDWELIATKAEAWLQAQTFPQGFGYIDVMLAAKQAIVLLQQKYRSRAKSEPLGLFT